MKNSLFKISFVFLIILIATFSLNAQEAIKVDETIRLRWDMGEMPGIYYFGLKLNENPAYKGVIIVYGPQKGFSIRYAERVRNQFKLFKLPNPERISAYYGGFREQSLMELWAVPNGAKLPTINPIISISQTALFDKYTYEKFPYFGQTKNQCLIVFANELKQNPTFKGHIIAYGIKERLGSEPPVYLSKVKGKVLNDKKLLRKLGISSSRIKTIVGGYDDTYPHAELWIVPEGAKPPEPTSSIEKASKPVKY